MLNFLKRFIWPSRISQESIGAILIDQRLEQNSIGTILQQQRQEISGLQNQALQSTKSLTEMKTRLDALQEIQASLKILQPHLFDIQFAVGEQAETLKKQTKDFEKHRENFEKHTEIVSKSHTANINGFSALNKNFQQETQLLQQAVSKAQVLNNENSNALNEKLKQETELLHKTVNEAHTANIEQLHALNRQIKEETLSLANKTEENKNLTVHEVTTVQSDIDALANKVSELHLAIKQINTNKESKDLTPLTENINNLIAETQLAITNSGFESRNILLHELSSQQTDIKEMKDNLSPIVSAIETLTHRVEQESLNTQNKSDENRNLTLHEVTTNQSELNAISNKVAELSQNFNETRSSSFAREPADLTPIIMAVQNLASETKLSVTNSGFESRNIMLHELTTQQTDIKELKNAVFELSNALHTLDLKVSSESVRQSAEIVSAFSGLNSKTFEPNPEKAPLPKEFTFDQAIKQAKKDHPKIFPLWFERLEELKTAFDQEGKHGNAANAADSYSNVFKSFVEGHAKGAILDIGCGVHGKPHYLHAFPDTQIAGLDPLDALEPANFVRQTGIGEYLPWEDNSFDTLISATAIDHGLSLDKSFKEMIRLLKPGGQVLMWVGSVDGSKKYTPKAKDYKPADRFHLFHIDKAWFEPELEKYFHIGAQINLWLPQHEHIFYQLTAK